MVTGSVIHHVENSLRSFMYTGNFSHLRHKIIVLLVQMRCLVVNARTRMTTLTAYIRVFMISKEVWPMISAIDW
jgi:type IV secretory pathway TrbL component